MKFLLFPLITVICLHSRIKAEEPYYSNTWMGEDYKLFINDKESLNNGYIYKFRTRYESNSRKILNDWQIANCLESTIDGELVPAIARYGYERGKPELIKEICR